MRRIIIAAALILVGTPSLAVSADRKMGDAESATLARALVEAESPKAVKLPGFGFDGMSPNPEFPHIEFFQAYSSVGQGIIGSYALDLYTGDAWDLTSCTEIKSAKLLGIQQRIRHRLGLTGRRYRQIRLVSSPCIPN